MAVSHWAPCTGHCICYCFPKHHGSFMYRNSAGSPALFFLGSPAGLSSGTEERCFSCRRSMAWPAFGVPLCAFYCTFGDILSNLLWCGMMIWLSFCSIAFVHGQAASSPVLVIIGMGVPAFRPTSILSSLRRCVRRTPCRRRRLRLRWRDEAAAAGKSSIFCV